MSETTKTTINIYGNHSVQILPDAVVAVQTNDNRRYYGPQAEAPDEEQDEAVADMTENINSQAIIDILPYFKGDRLLIKEYLPRFAQCMRSVDLAKLVADLAEDDRLTAVHKDVIKTAAFISKLQPLCPIITPITSVNNLRERIAKEMEARRQQRILNKKARI